MTNNRKSYLKSQKVCYLSSYEQLLLIMKSRKLLNDCYWTLQLENEKAPIFGNIQIIIKKFKNNKSSNIIRKAVGNIRCSNWNIHGLNCRKHELHNIYISIGLKEQTTSSQTCNIIKNYICLEKLALTTTARSSRYSRK